jgi:hypothetical protein
MDTKQPLRELPRSPRTAWKYTLNRSISTFLIVMFFFSSVESFIYNYMHMAKFKSLSKFSVKYRPSTFIDKIIFILGLIHL